MLAFTPSAQAAAAGRQIGARLAPLMTVAGFQAGHAGFGAEDVSITYCIKYPAFRSRFPHLAPKIHRSDPGACTDLTVSASVRDKPRLAEVGLDGHGVDELLRDVGRVDLAAQATALPEHPLAVGLDQLHGLLLEVFGRAAAATMRNEWKEDDDE